MGPQRFGVPKTQYVCNFFFDIALTMGSQRFAISRLQKCYKVLQNAISRSQKCYKVCTFRKSMATTMGSQRFGVAKTQYVCHFLFDLALTMGSQRFLLTKMPILISRQGDVIHWLCVACVGAASLGAGTGPAHRA